MALCSLIGTFYYKSRLTRHVLFLGRWNGPSILTMLGACSLPATALLQVLWVFLVLLVTTSGLEQPHVPVLQGSRSTASPNVHITEAPSQALIGKNIARRDLNKCTQWSILGGTYFVTHNRG